jgi:predicted helicase
MRDYLSGALNLALMVMRQVSMDGVFSHVGVTRVIPNNRCFYSTKGKISYFPLWLYAIDGELALSEDGLIGSNFKSGALSQIMDKLPATSKPSELGIVYYIYAVLHSPGYRSRYAEFLKSDFPRVPLTGKLELFNTLSRLGGDLVGLHVLEAPRLDRPITTYSGPENPEVEKVSWSKDTVWVDKAQTTGFKGVREEVWNFHIGGYQVCEKWLKDRKGRTLSKDDIAHYQRIVVALSETIRLMQEIDEVIDAHGGWPGAFSTGTTDSTKIPEARA